MFELKMTRIDDCDNALYYFQIRKHFVQFRRMDAVFASICEIFGFSLHNIHKFFASCAVFFGRHSLQFCRSFIVLVLQSKYSYSQSFSHILEFIFSLSIISLACFRFAILAYRGLSASKQITEARFSKIFCFFFFFVIQYCNCCYTFRTVSNTSVQIIMINRYKTCV
jgi:hypothetical protein